MTGDGGSRLCDSFVDKDPFLPAELMAPRPSLQPGLPGAEASARLAQTVGARNDFWTDACVPRFLWSLGTLPTVDRDLE